MGRQIPYRVRCPVCDDRALLRVGYASDNTGFLRVPAVMAFDCPNDDIPSHRTPNGNELLALIPLGDWPDSDDLI